MSEDDLIRPRPTNLSWEAAVTLEGGRLLVRNVIRTATGVFVFYLPPDMAVAMGRQLTGLGKRASRGIVVPQRTLLPPENPERN